MGHSLLLVEGKNDFHVIGNLLRVRGILDVKISSSGHAEDAQGFETLLQRLPVQWKESDLQRLAVIVDADEHLERRWQQLQYCVEHGCGLHLPQRPPPAGTIVHADDGRILAIWVMPDNTLSGMLEDFVATLIPKDDPILPHVDAFLVGIPEEQRRFSTQRMPKARIHTWLAVQEEPGRPMGQSITMRVLDAQSSDADLFVEWIRAALLS